MAKIKCENLNNLLKFVYLDGKFEDCLISIEGGLATINGLEKQQQLFVHNTENLGIEDCKLGIGNLKVLAGFTNVYAKQTMNLKIVDNRLILTTKDKNELRFLMSHPDAIPSQSPVDEPIKLAMQGQTVKLILNEKAVNDYMAYMKFTNCHSVSFVINEEGKMIMEGGLSSDHQFKVEFGEIELIDDDYEFDNQKFTVLREFLTSVLKVLEFKEDENPEMFFGSEDTMVIRQNDNRLWALRVVSKNDQEN